MTKSASWPGMRLPFWLSRWQSWAGSLHKSLTVSKSENPLLEADVQNKDKPVRMNRNCSNIRVQGKKSMWTCSNLKQTSYNCRWQLHNVQEEFSTISLYKAVIIQQCFWDICCELLFWSHTKEFYLWQDFDWASPEGMFSLVEEMCWFFFCA